MTSDEFNMLDDIKRDEILDEWEENFDSGQLSSILFDGPTKATGVLKLGSFIWQAFAEFIQPMDPQDYQMEDVEETEEPEEGGEG